MNLKRKKEFFHNPVITGGYPDPSVCRVKDTYYMVTSSFSYFPGLPIFKSRDLVHWEQIANAISRPEQLDFRNCDVSEGLWAATIRYHDGIFYIVNTLDVEGRTCRYNFIITASDPAGEWSDAVIIEGADGIDPSLYFDEKGRMWYCGNAVPQVPEYPEHKVIYLCEVDKDTFQFKGMRHIIFDGALEHSLYMEGPHIYKINDYYYLITACGGTQTNHCVHIARSLQLLGPYEPCSRNPIVTNRNLPLINALGVGVTGHGDLVKTQKEEWYMVLLGIRPYNHLIENYQCYLPRKWIRTPDRNKNAQFNLGREVFLIPIAWDYDDWPLVDNENGMVNLTERRPDLPIYRPPFHSRVDNFEADTLDMVWCMRRPVKDLFYSLSERPGYLRIHLLPGRVEDKATPSMLVRRQQHNDFCVSSAMEFEPSEEGEEAGLVITQNERFSYLMIKVRKDSKNWISCCSVINGERMEMRSEEVKPGRIYLYIEGGEGHYTFSYGYREREKKMFVQEAEGSILSTVVADGFVGTYLGLYGSNGGRSEGKACIKVSAENFVHRNHADFDWFSYETIEDL